MSDTEDVVELVLAGETVLAKEYQVDVAFLMAPNAFSVSIGSGTTAIDLMQRYPPNTPFALKVNGVTQFMGRTDGFERPKGEYTELHITGRDRMAQIVDDKVRHDRSFANATFEEITRAALKAALRNQGYSLVFDARAHRQAVTGTPLYGTQTIVSDPVKGKAGPLELRVVRVDERVGPVFDTVPERVGVTTVETTVKYIKGYKADKPIEWKAGTTWYQALKKEYDRGGLFLRAGVDPEGEDENVFLLSEPSAAQTPLIGMVNTRAPNPADNVVSVLPPRITNVTTGMHSEYIVRGRSGGGKGGLKQIEGVFIDGDLLALGIDKTDVHVDEHVVTELQAQYLARKRCADARRACRVFTYTIPRRHTAPLLSNPRRRAILAPDICVALKDDENGMEGVFWVERVKHYASANGPTGTDVTLMVPDDVVFGEGEFLSDATRKVCGRHRKK